MAGQIHVRVDEIKVYDSNVHCPPTCLVPSPASSENPRLLLVTWLGMFSNGVGTGMRIALFGVQPVFGRQQSNGSRARIGLPCVARRHLGRRSLPRSVRLSQQLPH